ncbi:MAG: DNA polymerase III subunit gamma/tau [Spirochaetes bacterium]|nr:DNA polymerase III subunit gamma/tau [Spirochaetota bacterium]
MPYEVTAARKRPQTFEQLAGQSFVAATLEKSLATGRIAHAYLFAGPRGCGKTSTARILAKALNCEKGPAAEPCGTCDSCKAITAGSSLDVIEIDGASNTSVDNVRQIKDEVLFPPNSSRYKIYIIDEVHMLSTSAFNALLKTIEEPPPYVVFMFATTEPHKVPATIKSRCQQFSFRLVDAETIVGLLASAAAETGIDADEEALLWIAKESGGSIRDAYTLFDQVVSFAGGKITAALIREKLGIVGQDRMNALFGRFVAGNTAAALSDLDGILAGGVSPEQFVADMVEYCRALLLIVNGVVKESLLGAPLSSFDLSISEALGEDKTERVLSIFLSVYRIMKDSIDPRYELDLAVAKASHIADYVSPADLAKAVDSLRRFVERGARPAAAVSSPSSLRPPAARTALPQPTNLDQRTESAGEPGQAASRASLLDAEPPDKPAESQPEALPDPSDLGQLKKALVAEIRKNNVLLGTTLEKSGSWYIEGGTLHITVANRMGFDLLRRFSGIIAEVLTQKLGSAQRVDFELEAEQGGWTGLKQDRAAPVTPPVFNDSASAQGKERAGPVPAVLPAAEPDLNEREKEAVGLVERYFKGSVIGYAQPSLPAEEPVRAEQPDLQSQD